jgi:rubrerythrin
MSFWDDSGYELSDPKHPTFHERYADIWDNRDKTRTVPRCRSCGNVFLHGEAPDGLCGLCRRSDKED